MIGVVALLIISLLILIVAKFWYLRIGALVNLMEYLRYALFVIACGLTILETAANPFASSPGPPETATLRLNFS